MLRSKVAGLFKAVSHPTRLAIVDLLSSGEQCVCEIMPALGVEQSTLSKHLSVLRRERVVCGTRQGSKVMYSLADDRIVDVVRVARQIVSDGLYEEFDAWKRTTVSAERGGR